MRFIYFISLNTHNNLLTLVLLPSIVQMSKLRLWGLKSYSEESAQDGRAELLTQG